MLPLPLNAQLQYTQSAQYPTVLGDNALPREWYKVPAQHHLNVWTQVDHPYTQQNFVRASAGCSGSPSASTSPRPRSRSRRIPDRIWGNTRKKKAAARGRGLQPKTQIRHASCCSVRFPTTGITVRRRLRQKRPWTVGRTKTLRSSAQRECWSYENPEELDGDVAAHVARGQGVVAHQGLPRRTRRRCSRRASASRPMRPTCWSSPTSSTWSGEGARCCVRRRERASNAACARRSRHRLTD